MTTTKKTVALVSTSALAAGAAHGAILYTPVNITLSPNGALNLDLNQDGVADFQLTYNTGLNPAIKPYITNMPPVLTTSFVLSGSSNDGLPITPSGTLINGSYLSAQSTGYFYEDKSFNVDGSWTNTGNMDGYVGLQLQDGSGTHYGWAHFIYNTNGVSTTSASAGTITLVDAAMETTPSVGILTGQTAEISTAPVVAVLPLSQTNYLGGTAQFTVAAAGNPAPAYQWQSGVVGSGIYSPLPIGGRIAASTTDTDGAMSTLKITGLTSANMADYVVVVSNSAGAVTSSIPATLTVLAASDAPATLMHRYSFQDPAHSSSFVDSVGGPLWAGGLSGTATLTGSSLQLDGSSGCFAILPANLISGYSQLTVEFWADIGNNPVWTRVFSFGEQSANTKESGVDYCPYAGGNYQNLDLLDASGHDAYANNPAGVNNTTSQHITVVVDSINNQLYYYNGANVVSSLNTTVPSLANVADANNWIGASFVSSDPYLAGTIHEFRVYQGVLPAKAVALNDAVGPANYIQLSANPALGASLSGGNIVLSWPVSDFRFAVQSASVLSHPVNWTTLTNQPVLVGTNWQVSLPAAGAKFFQLIAK